MIGADIRDGTVTGSGGFRLPNNANAGQTGWTASIEAVPFESRPVGQTAWSAQVAVPEQVPMKIITYAVCAR